MSSSEDDEFLLNQAKNGNRSALDQLFAVHRDNMHRVVDVRLDAALRQRLDASDVVQEAFLEAARRLPDYLERRPMPFSLWLRQTAYTTAPTYTTTPR